MAGTTDRSEQTILNQVFDSTNTSLGVTLDTKISGEDQTNDRMMTLDKFSSYRIIDAMDGSAASTRDAASTRTASI
jgi:hypothetical protein